MSCPICHRSSCTLSFHSLAAQERYEARQSMSDDVDVLREQLQEAQEEIASLKADLERAEDMITEMGERMGE
jgi:peptidoglycan hydrolase CwlO-like protein